MCGRAQPNNFSFSTPWLSWSINSKTRWILEKLNQSITFSLVNLPRGCLGNTLPRPQTLEPTPPYPIPNATVSSIPCIINQNQKRTEATFKIQNHVTQSGDGFLAESSNLRRGNGEAIARADQRGRESVAGPDARLVESLRDHVGGSKRSKDSDPSRSQAVTLSLSLPCSSSWITPTD